MGNLRACISLTASEKSETLVAPAACFATPNRVLPWLTLCLFLITGTVTFSAQEYVIAPPSDWVLEVSMDKTADLPEDAITDGLLYMLIDTQSHPKAATPEYFEHYAMKVINQSGIPNVSRISIDFHPSFQALIVHGISVRRDGRALDRLQPDSISVLQREEMLEAQIFDGAKTFNVILDDVRVGDIVEYSFTTCGANPILQGAYYRGVTTQWRVPVRRFHHRLLWPQETPLHMRSHGLEIEPGIRAHNGLNEYIFTRENTPAIVADSDLPSWHCPYPWVQFSESGTWAEVAVWGTGLYAIPRELSPELESVIRDIAAKTETPEERVTRALRFVQEEVRYMGIEIGPASYKPHHPSVVMARRFGDCKDKTLLLHTMLNAMGIESFPALVNQHLLHKVEEWLPTPFAFTHVILLVKLDGREYWLDPAINHQRGSLDHLDQPDYRLALVLDEGTRDLTPMHPPKRLSPDQSVQERFDLRKGYREPADLTIETIYRGARADSMRAWFAGNSTEEMEKSYVNFYASLYPDISMQQPMSIDDNEETNVITVIETYRIPNFWQESEDGSSIEGLFRPLELYNLIDTPVTRRRSMPLGVFHPIHYRLTTDVLLPEEWTIEPEVFHVGDDAITFDYRVRYRPSHLTLEYVYRTKQDHVSSEKAQEHIADLERIDEQVGYIIYTSPQSEPAWFHEINWSAVVLAVSAFLVSLVMARKVYRYDPETSEPMLLDPRFGGIRGLLLVVTLVVVMQPVSILVTLGSTLDAYALSRWNYLSSPASEGYHVLWQPLLIYELVFNVSWLVFSVLMAILFFQKRNTFPKVYVIYLFVTLMINTGDKIGARMIPGIAEEGTAELIANIFGSLFGFALYALYFRSSRRVENTFVRTLRPKVGSIGNACHEASRGIAR